MYSAQVKAINIALIQKRNGSHLILAYHSAPCLTFKCSSCHAVQARGRDRNTESQSLDTQSQTGECHTDKDKEKG